MFRKIVLSTLAVAMLSGAALTAAGNAQAQQWDQQRPYRGDYAPPPPPGPPPGRHHHNNNGRIIAGGIAAGVIGGLLGGALANGGGNVYAEPPPPPPPRCWFEDRPVHNQYDDGWHQEQVRVCS